MRSLRALKGLRALTSTALNEVAEVSTRSLTTTPDLKSVLREKIPEQQVRKPGIEAQMLIKSKPESIGSASLN